jgi:1L-myo-inositol 1-phosphate cytidylyltransferase / CDP-L-myo-inositol myo-inositolphosphotransferase
MALQILIPLPESSPLIVGMPSALRAAGGAERAGLGPVFLGTRDPDFESRWTRVLKRLPAASWLRLNGQRGLPPELDPEAPLLLLSPKHIPLGSPKDFPLPADASTAAVWTSGTGAVAAYFPRASQLGDLPWERMGSVSSDAFASAIDSQGSGLRALDGPRSVRQAERSLLASLGGKADGFLARYDRAVSTRISALLSRTSVTPNQITTLSLLLSLSGAWWLATGSYAVKVLGAGILWFAAILDGCDGEVARLTYQSSPEGARYDMFADHVAHAAAFAAIAGRVGLRHPDRVWLLPAVLLVSGVGGCMFVMWWRIRRLPPERRNRAALLFQKLGSRDYVYVIFVLALCGRLHWLFWGAAIGSHVFWLAVLALA